ncbi:MAG: hypothetical protein EA381_15460 [Planctomycetaceae bacterium]|nr:MAG: hypothetical protein EA381_15460 [Planctomycetaceae bacterium]
MFAVRRFVCLLLLVAMLLDGRGVADEPATAGTRVVAHRGLLQHAPENTLGNFRACLELNLGFEFDVLRTRDGELVCIHDDSVDRTTDGQGKVAELTLEEIRQLDAGGWFDARFAGQRVPTIDEVLALVAEYRDRDVLIAVDIKAEQVEAELIALAKRHGVLDKLLFIGRTITDDSVRRRLIRSAAVRTAAVANDPTEFAAALAAAEWVYFRYLPSAEEMRQVRAAGKGSFIAGATVAGNLPDNWRQAIDVGVDAILTDHPLELAALLRELPRSDSSEGR